MALVKKVGTGFEGGHSYKSSFDSVNNPFLHQQLLESWGLKTDGVSDNRFFENQLLFGAESYTKNKGGKGVYYFHGGEKSIIYETQNNNFELVCACKRSEINNYVSDANHLVIVANGGSKKIIGTFGDLGIKWSPDNTTTMTDLSSLDAWTNAYGIWHVKCSIWDDGGTFTLRIYSVGKAQTKETFIDYPNVSSIDEIRFSAQGGRSSTNMFLDDLTIWEDTDDSNAKTDIDNEVLQPHIRYIAPMADQTAYTTNGTTDDWTFKSVSNEADLTDGADATYSEMTTNEGGLITDSSQTDLSGTIAAAGYTVNTVESIAAAGFKVEDNEENTFVGTLNSDGTGGGTTKTAVVAQGSSTPAYIRFDEADLTTEGITKNTKAATTFKLQ